MELASKTNVFAKECIVEALIKLMKDKSFSEIKIVDIVKKAGVSRMTYYRNYTSKEDIFKKHLSHIIEVYSTTIEAKEKERTLRNRDNLVRCFEYFYGQKDFTRCLIKANMLNILFDGINEYVLNKAKAVGFEDNIVQIYMYVGALFNVYIQWIKDESIGTKEQLASMVSAFTG